jgi:hypothetical protein
MSYNSQYLLNTKHKCIYACYNCCSEEKVDVKSLKDDAEFQAYATPDRLLVKFEDFISRISCITLIIFYSLLVIFSWYYCWLFTDEITICIELDPSIHIVMHSVSSLKPGVTRNNSFSLFYEHLTFCVCIHYDMIIRCFAWFFWNICYVIQILFDRSNT